MHVRDLFRRNVQHPQCPLRSSWVLTLVCVCVCVWMGVWVGGWVFRGYLGVHLEMLIELSHKSRGSCCGLLLRFGEYRRECGL